MISPCLRFTYLFSIIKKAQGINDRNNIWWKEGGLGVYVREQAFQALRNVCLETISLLIREDFYQIPQSLILALPLRKGSLLQWQTMPASLTSAAFCNGGFSLTQTSSLSLTLGAVWRWSWMGGVMGVPQEAFSKHMMNRPVTWVMPQWLQVLYSTQYLAVILLVFLIGRAKW